jgi:hypothetical protein
MIAESPKPKSISSYGKHSGVVVRNDPITPQSVRAQELPTLSFGRAVSHVKGQMYGGLPQMSKGCSLNQAQIMGLGAPNVSMPPMGKKKSALCEISDFDADSFI